MKFNEVTLDIPIEEVELLVLRALGLPEEDTRIQIVMIPADTKGPARATSMRITAPGKDIESVIVTAK